VRVALYYESLCPSSADFVVNHLAKIFKDGLLDAADVTLVPYGNAKVRANGAISCQVGVPSSAAPDPFVCSSLLSFFLWLQTTVDVSRFRWDLLGDVGHGLITFLNELLMVLVSDV
jgi:hypothetical protein